VQPRFIAVANANQIERKEEAMEEGYNSLHPYETSGAFRVNILLGIWVIVAPFVLASALFSAAIWNNIATGIAVAIVALLRTSMPRQSAWSWANVILGIWLLISPFVLGFAAPRLLWNDVILGIIIALVGISNAWWSVRREHVAQF
jgi:hypothetical protein